MSKKAFITGIAGQDGSYLTEYLIEQGYEVHGIIRRNSTPEHQVTRLDHLEKNIHTYYGDLLDPPSLSKLLKDIQPDEIYNLAAQSHVRISFDVPQFTGAVNALGVTNLLEITRSVCPEAKFYQASSSEMFGNSCDEDGFQRLSTPMNPVSPYGCAKLYGFHMVNTYRDSYNMFACNGILFNHESPRRASNFVTAKVVKTAIEIQAGLTNTLALGNLDSYRDWGHSKDYVRAMHMILNHDVPQNWIVSSMHTHSIRELCQYVFSKLGLNYENYVVQDPRYLRPKELKYLKGDSTAIRTELGWKPQYSFETLLDEMIEFYHSRA